MEIGALSLGIERRTFWLFSRALNLLKFHVASKMIALQISKLIDRIIAKKNQLELGTPPRTYFTIFRIQRFY